MFPLVEPRQRPERFRLNRHSPLAESAAFLGLGGFDAAGSVWYPDARRLLGGVPNDGTLTNMDPATDWVWSPELGRWTTDLLATSNQYISLGASANLKPTTVGSWSIWGKPSQTNDYAFGDLGASGNRGVQFQYVSNTAIGVYVAPTSTTLYGIATTAVPAYYNSWTHFLVVFIGGSGLFVYQNGTLVYSLTSSPPASLYQNALSLNIGTRGDNTDYMTGPLSDMMIAKADWSPFAQQLADPSNVMLEVGGVPLILPPRRVSFPAAVAEPSGFKPYWARRSSQIIGGGVA